MTTVSIEQVEEDIRRIDDRLATLRVETQELEGKREWFVSIRDSLSQYVQYAETQGRDKPTAAPSAQGHRAPTITEWAEKVLSKLPPGEDSLQDTWALIHMMEADGYSTTADKKYLAVYGSLNRAKGKPGSAIVRVGSRWGLRSWYPEGVPVVPSPSPKLDLDEI